MKKLRFTGVIGLDPAWAKPSVAAYVGRDGRWMFFASTQACADCWAGFFGQVAEAGCLQVVIEEPYLGANPATFKKLVTAVAILEGHAVEAGLEVKRVNTQEWMTGMLTINGHTPKLREELLVRMVYVARLLGADVSAKEDDKASAVCLAEYGAAVRRVVG